MVLCVVDLKNITEANASYSAEVCLYAVFLSNWLHSVGKALLTKFFISDRVYLWRHTEMPRFTKVMGTKESGDHGSRLAALRADLADGRRLIALSQARLYIVPERIRRVEFGHRAALKTRYPVAFRLPSYGGAPYA